MYMSLYSFYMYFICICTIYNTRSICGTITIWPCWRLAFVVTKEEMKAAHGILKHNAITVLI